MVDVDVAPATRTVAFGTLSAIVVGRDLPAVALGAIPEPAVVEPGLVPINRIVAIRALSTVVVGLAVAAHARVGAFIDILDIKPNHVEIIFTGYKYVEALVRIADYVTNIEMLKHPYYDGMDARKGIEF